MKYLFIISLLALCCSKRIYNLEETSSIVLSCADSTWLSIPTNPSSGFLWYSPSNNFIIQQDSLGFYKSGSQYFSIKCSEKALAGKTYGIDFYYVDAAYSLIYQHQVAVFISHKN